MTKRENNIEIQQSQIKQSKNYTEIIAELRGTKFPQSKLTTPTTINPIIM